MFALALYSVRIYSNSQEWHRRNVRIHTSSAAVKGIANNLDSIFVVIIGVKAEDRPGLVHC